MDTHIFIWWDSKSASLSSSVRSLCADPENALFLSLVSIWEMQIKAQLGKLHLGKPLSQIVTEQLQQNGIRILPIELPHIYALESLPPHHRDPFDRLLISQAIVEDMVLLSDDVAFTRYAVQVRS